MWLYLEKKKSEMVTCQVIWHGITLHNKINYLILCSTFLAFAKKHDKDLPWSKSSTEVVEPSHQMQKRFFFIPLIIAAAAAAAAAKKAKENRGRLQRERLQREREQHLRRSGQLTITVGSFYLVFIINQLVR